MAKLKAGNPIRQHLMDTHDFVYLDKFNSLEYYKCKNCGYIVYGIGIGSAKPYYTASGDYKMIGYECLTCSEIIMVAVMQ